MEWILYRENTTSEMKNSLDGPNSLHDTAEEKVSEHQENEVEIIETGGCREKD